MARGMRTFFPMIRIDAPPDSVDAVAARLAALLTGGGSGLQDPTGSDLVFEPRLALRPLERSMSVPVETWAVDGGQSLVADARCLQVYATRSSRVCWSGPAGGAVVEEALPMRVWLLGMGESGAARRALDAPVAPDCFVDVNLLREWGEWSAAAGCVAEAQPGSLVLVDGDLSPDWRIATDWLPGIFDVAADRGVSMLGVTKHTSLSWGGAPVLGVLERMAADEFGPRALWWARIARTSPSVGPGVQVLVACLDPDARFAFRVDVPGDVPPEAALSSLSAVCDDAAFPGYPYPLAAADRLASCPPWVRDEVWSRIDEEFDRAGLPLDVRERAFTDRHRLMERY